MTIHEDATDQITLTATPLDPSPRRNPWGQYIRQGGQQLWHQHRRNLLTSCGLIIGVAALVSALTLALTAQSVIGARLGGYPTDVLSISAVANPGMPTQPLRSDDVTALKALPSVQQVSQVTTITADITANDRHATVSVSGVTPAWATIQQWTVATGNWITADDEQSGRAVVVLGSAIATTLFHTASAANDQTVVVQGQPYIVRGVLDDRSPTASYPSDDAIYLPHTTFTYRLRNVPTVTAIVVQAETGIATSIVKDDITALLRLRHQLAPTTRADFRVQTAADTTRTTQQQVQTGIVVLGAIAVVALLLGSVALILATATTGVERRDELLLLRTLGARAADITRQLVVEMLVLSAVAGVIGCLVAEVVIAASLRWLALPFLFAPVAVLIGIVVALLIGLCCAVPSSRQISQRPTVLALRLRW